MSDMTGPIINLGPPDGHPITKQMIDSKYAVHDPVCPFYGEPNKDANLICLTCEHITAARINERVRIATAIDTARQRRWDMVSADDWDDTDLPGHEEGVEFGLRIAAKIARSGGK